MAQRSESSGGGRFKSYRSRHRMRSHQEAHDAAEGDALPPPVLAHALVPSNEPSIVQDAQDLAGLVDRIRTAGSFGYDSEFIGEHTYHPRLCVIQVATADEIALIDPLQQVDLTPFWELLADPAVEKIVHAGVQDLEPVVRHLDLPPRHVFDVQICAAFVGMHYPSALGKLVRELADADLGRGLKFSQWDHRPLSPVQVQYAANDVRYLPLVRSIIAGKLDELGNTAWAMAECATLEELSLYRYDASRSRIRVRGIDALGPRRRAILDAMLAWREETARQEDVPPRAFIKDGVLFDLVRSKVSTLEDLDQIRGLPRPVRQHYGKAIVDTITGARTQPVPRVDRKQLAAARDLVVDRTRINALWEQVAARAEQRHIAPAIVTSKKELTRHIYAAELGHNRAHLRICQGWRQELLQGIITA